MISLDEAAQRIDQLETKVAQLAVTSWMGQHGECSSAEVDQALVACGHLYTPVERDAICTYARTHKLSDYDLEDLRAGRKS